MARLPLPLTDADRDAGYWWELSMRQVETSRTLVFDRDVHARAFFEALLCENMDLGRPENVELLFRRGQRAGGHSSTPPGGGFKTKIDRYCNLVTLNVFYKSSRLKQYLKDPAAGPGCRRHVGTSSNRPAWSTGRTETEGRRRRSCPAAARSHAMCAEIPMAPTPG